MNRRPPAAVKDNAVELVGVIDKVLPDKLQVPPRLLLVLKGPSPVTLVGDPVKFSAREFLRLEPENVPSAFKVAVPFSITVSTRAMGPVAEKESPTKNLCKT